MYFLNTYVFLMQSISSLINFFQFKVLIDYKSNVTYQLEVSAHNKLATSHFRTL
jgi:hypothetical protein